MTSEIQHKRSWQIWTARCYGSCIQWCCTFPNVSLCCLLHGTHAKKRRGGEGKKAKTKQHPPKCENI